MSTELEKEILGQLILAPQLLELSDSLEAYYFSSDDGRKVFAGIKSTWTDGKPEVIDLGILAAKTGLSLEFISGLVSGNYRPTAESFAWRIRELKRKRANERALKLAQDEGEHLVKTGEIDPAKLGEIRAAFVEIEELDRKTFDPAAVLMSGKAIQVLQLEAEWAVEKLVPARSITVLHSPGGLGKTWLSLALANAVSRGEPFLGLKTKPGPVCYIDFENPLPLLVERTRKLDIRDVLFWHLSANPSPPRIDTSDYKFYRQLPPGALIIFDTLRAAHSGDENSSQDMALVMGRLKELRELNHPVFLIHHTGKASERLYKGSTAISDLADHVLKLYQSRRGGLEEIFQDEGELDPGATFVLTTGKTRYAQFHIHLTFDPAAGAFSLAEDPNIKTLEALADHIAGPGLCQNQTEILTWAKNNFGPSRKEKYIALLERGEREGRWQSRRSLKGAKFFEPKSRP